MLKVLRWLIFGAVVSLLPLAFAYNDLSYTLQQATLEKIIGNGELLVIVWVLSASAIGELFGSGSKLAILKVIAGGLSLLIILDAGHAFATITQAKAAKIAVDEALVVSSSIKLFLWSLVPSIACVAITEISDE
jgi:hypothetical protein